MPLELQTKTPDPTLLTASLSTVQTANLGFRAAGAAQRPNLSLALDNISNTKTSLEGHLHILHAPLNSAVPPGSGQLVQPRPTNFRAAGAAQKQQLKVVVDTDRAEYKPCPQYKKPLCLQHSQISKETLQFLIYVNLQLQIYANPTMGRALAQMNFRPLSTKTTILIGLSKRKRMPAIEPPA